MCEKTTILMFDFDHRTGVLYIFILTPETDTNTSKQY